MLCSYKLANAYDSSIDNYSDYNFDEVTEEELD